MIEGFLKKFHQYINEPQRRRIYESNEEAIRVSFFVKLLELIGWDFSDPLNVELEYQTPEGDKIDVVLKEGSNRPIFVWEVKALNKLDSQSELVKAKKQLGKYMSQIGGKTFYGLTDGVNWFLFLKRKIDEFIKITFNLDNQEEIFKFFCLLCCLQPKKAVNTFDKCLQSCFYMIDEVATTPEEKKEEIRRIWNKLALAERSGVKIKGATPKLVEFKKSQIAKSIQNFEKVSNKSNSSEKKKIYGKKHIFMRIKLENGDIINLQTPQFTKLIDELVVHLVKHNIINLKSIPKIANYYVIAKKSEEAGARPGKVEINGETWYVYRGGTNKELQLKYLAKLLIDILGAKEAYIEDKTNNIIYELDVANKQFLEKSNQ